MGFEKSRDICAEFQSVINFPKSKLGYTLSLTRISTVFR